MIRTNIKDQYFNWLINQIAIPDINEYSKLMCALYGHAFEYILEMDANRLYDGIDLKYRFGYEHNIPPEKISLDLDSHFCSVLEMMVALAIRCEVHIMHIEELGNRAAEWFWEMIDSLNLRHMTDDNFDEIYVLDTLDKLINREYLPDGSGGLFYINGIDDDMREIEIWYQMSMYLNLTYFT